MTALLYIILFLHQTTTSNFCEGRKVGCISYYSYIKPQLRRLGIVPILVVYRTIPTSNHNLWANSRLSGYVVYRTIPTSNHNKTIFIVLQAKVVYRTIPTSNHNFQSLWKYFEQLYIVLFLHQTTTSACPLKEK